MMADVEQFESCISLKLPAKINGDGHESSDSRRHKNRIFFRRDEKKTICCKRNQNNEDQPKQAFLCRDEKLNGIYSGEAEHNDRENQA